MDLNIVISSINFVVIIIFALVVFLRGVKNKINISFLILGFIVAFWILTNLLADLSKDVTAALFWARSAILGPAFLPIVFFYLVAELFNQKKLRKIIFVLYFLASLVTTIFAFTSQNIEKVYLSPSGTEYAPGSLYYFLFVYLLIGFGYTFSILINIYRESPEPIRSQARLILIGSSSSIFLAIVLNIILPILGFSIFSILGPPSVLFFIFFTALAILKYHLFDFKTIATELFTFIIWIILFIRTLLSKNSQDLLINVGLLLAMVVFGLLLIRSILNEVRQREKMEKMAEEVKKAYEIEKKAKEELQLLDKAKNQFLLTTQHHLRTPLTSMIGYVDLMLSGAYGKQSKKTRDVIQRFQVSTSSLIKMVNEFLDITQFQLGREVVSLKLDTQVDLIIKEIVKELEFETKKKGIYLKFEKPKEEYLIKADPQKLKAALFNIFDNAVKYTQKGGVTIKMENHTKNVKIIVEDTGIGISPEGLKNMFNKTFERGEQAKKEFVTGRGIGLYIASQIIKAHNGKLWAESEGEGKGSTFHIELPIEKK